MNRFKVGQRVIRIAHNYLTVQKGKTYIVSENGKDGSNIIRLRGHPGRYDSNFFELEKNPFNFKRTIAGTLP